MFSAHLFQRRTGRTRWIGARHLSDEIDGEFPLYLPVGFASAFEHPDIRGATGSALDGTLPDVYHALSQYVLRLLTSEKALELDDVALEVAV